MKSNRILNGYVVIYKPEHPKAMKSNNWMGYIYEHIVIAEEEYGRALRDDEEVHHLDTNRENNRASNLIIVDKTSHRKLHKWIENGMFISKDNHNVLRCEVCNKPLKEKQKRFCSKVCTDKGITSKLDALDVKVVLNEIAETSMVRVAKHYGVSDNGLRKWLYSRGSLNKETLNSELKRIKMDQ